MTLRGVGRSITNTVVEGVGRIAGRVQESRPLSADLLESDEAYLVVFDAPGVSGSDVQVRFVDEEVLVRIDRFREFREGFEMRFPGRGLTLDGRVALPDAAVDAGAATAILEDNGTLHVRIPKRDDTTDTDDEPIDLDEPDAESTP